MSGFESWIDRQIREAQERGEFDNLPGAGKPIKGLGDRRDDDWWAKDLIRREQLPMPLPASLALRKEVEDLPQRLVAERSEQTVREIITDLNRRVLLARRRADSGPPVFVRTVDEEQAVGTWRQAREDRARRRQAALDEHRRARDEPDDGR